MYRVMQGQHAVTHAERSLLGIKIPIKSKRIVLPTHQRIVATVPDNVYAPSLAIVGFSATISSAFTFAHLDQVLSNSKQQSHHQI